MLAVVAAPPASDQPQLSLSENASPSGVMMLCESGNAPFARAAAAYDSTASIAATIAISFPLAPRSGERVGERGPLTRRAFGLAASPPSGARRRMIFIAGGGDGGP